MPVDHASKGNKLMAEAEQKLSITQGGGLCCGSTGRAKVEEACELYVKAANSYKMAKDWGAAGRAFAEAASLELENNRSHEAGNHYVEASKCYKKVSPIENARYLEKAIEIYIDMGRQKVAAKHHKTLAELYEEEGELKDLAKSIHHHEMASDLFAGEESQSSSTRCQLQIAKHSALLGDHAKAIEMYERIGKEALNSSLLKYTADDLFFRAGLCKLYLFASDDPEQAASNLRSALAEYEECNPAFGDSREKTFLINLAKAVSDGDTDAFNEAIRSHESISRLDPWYHEIIRTIRRYVQGEDLR